MTKKTIDSDFPKLNPSAWKQLIQFQLEGEDYAKQMIYHSLEGIDIKPFYTQEDVKQPIEFPKKDWSIDESIAVYNADNAVQMAEEAIEFGADSIRYKLFNPELSFKSICKGIDLDRHQVRISLQQLSEELIERIKTSDLKNVVFCVDPISKFYATGTWYHDQKTDFELLLKFLKLKKKGFITRLEIDNYPIAESGANLVSQLALINAHLAEYLHYAETHKALDLIEEVFINTGTGSNYFFEIAKTRALRLMLPGLFEAFDQKVIVKISSQTLSRYYTAYNAVQNLVRSSTSLLSSVLSSSDFISGLAHDCLTVHPNSKSNRLIRNQLLLLKHEAGLAEHQDAANGSYYINYLSEQLAQKALQQFKQVEAKGGLIDELKTGSIQRELKAQHLKELDLYKSNRELLIGTNAYKDKKERLKHKAERKPFLKKKTRKTLIIPIVKRRIASNWEEKRWNNE